MSGWEKKEGWCIMTGMKIPLNPPFSKREIKGEGTDAPP
jgi:hypothetical protein